MSAILTIYANGVRTVIPDEGLSVQILYKDESKGINAHFVMPHEDVYDACTKFTQDMVSSGKLVCRRGKESVDRK